MRRSFAVSPLSSFLGPYGILPPLPLRRRRLQMFHLPFSLSPLLSLSLFYFSLFLSLILLLCLSPTGFGWSRFSSVLLTVRIPPPAIGECMQCSCVFSLAPPPPSEPFSPFHPSSCCSVYKWKHHPCVSCGTFLNRTHSDPL